MNSDKNAYFLSLPEITELSVPPKTILLEEGKVADRMYLIRKGCLRLFFNNEGRDITFQFFFEGDFVASFDSCLLYTSPGLVGSEMCIRDRCLSAALPFPHKEHPPTTV